VNSDIAKKTVEQSSMHCSL